MNPNFRKALTLALSSSLLFGCGNSCEATKLPKPVLEDGIRGEQFGIDKNVNESTLDNYLDLKDVVYRDMRMLIDPANYASIGGDSYLSGFVEGFEVVPYPYLVNVVGLPAEVGSSYSGTTLFNVDDKGNYSANYKESMSILESLFPKDKTIILMCGGGGYAGMTKTMLIALGWDKSKLYNVGGYWYYEGNNKVEVARNSENGIVYDFYKVAYHNIDFESLTPIK